MKYVTKIILIMTCLIIMLPFSGCGRKKQVTAQKAGVLKPEAPGKEVLDHGEAVVDISNVAQGYVALRYKGSAKKISVEVIGKNNKVYKYFIEQTKEPTYFPLTSGNGTYQISVYENVQDDEYGILMMDSFEVKLKNKFLPFLYPNQYVEFTSKTKAVKEAKKLSNEELITFCGQMALILKSGISSLEGIYIMEDGDVQTEGREILKEIREELEMCGMLYPAMEKTGVFPEYALHMTEIGEQTGRLDETMEALAAYYQREEEILDAVKSAVTYPVAMLGMLLVIVAVLFIKVMPVFEQVYMQLGQEMTGVARQLLNIGDWMRQSAIVLVVLAVVILIIVFFVIFYKKARIEFISKIQTIGFMKKIAWKRARTRFAGGMAMALKSGIDMDESLKEAVIKGAVQCYSVEGRYPESLSYMEKHYGLEYDKDI